MILNEKKRIFKIIKIDDFKNFPEKTHIHIHTRKTHKKIHSLSNKVSDARLHQLCHPFQLSRY